MKVCLCLLVLLPAVLGIVYTPGTDTCESRCLDHYKLYNECQCTENCELFGDCCVDFYVHCVEPEVPIDSCEGKCGKFTPGNPCQCNEGCVSFGDCCEDYDTLCGDAPDPNVSCEGRCTAGYQSQYDCQCNDQCPSFGNCCGDYEKLCLGIVPTTIDPGLTCVGRCGNTYDPTEACQCNVDCPSYSNCCDDYIEQCIGVPTTMDPGLTCVGRCGNAYDPTEACQCNVDCPSYSNCCDDYIEQCIVTSTANPGLTCVGRCDNGFESGKPCQCNDQCESFNNCCDDYVEQCTADDFTCKDQCFIDYDSGRSCQCNTQCADYGNCCPDYEDECFSNTTCRGRCFVEINDDLFCECETGCDVEGTCCDDFLGECVGSCDGRCGLPFDSSEDCQCNDACLSHADCCLDYNDVCLNGTGPQPISNSDIANLAETLWTLDVNRIASSDYVTSKQGLADENNPVDNAVNPFYTSFNESALSSLTYTTFMALLDNYIAQTGTKEIYTLQELEEIEQFLDAVFDTDVMNATTQFFIEKAWYSTEAEFRAWVKEVWFGNYSRKESDPDNDSSGFEHVFVGEIKSGVSGFHNWLQFYLQERDGSINYYGYHGEVTPNQIATQFKWDGELKEYGSMIVGASPEFELAMLSLCFRVKPGAVCPFTLDGSTSQIQTYNIRDIYIGSAYFIV